MLGTTRVSCPENITGYVMGNGLTVVAEPIPHVRSVAVGFWILAGSRDEEPGEQGVSHFLEHLLFKGTEKRSARQIAETMDQVLELALDKKTQERGRRKKIARQRRRPPK